MPEVPTWGLSLPSNLCEKDAQGYIPKNVLENSPKEREAGLCSASVGLLRITSFWEASFAVEQIELSGAATGASPAENL